jgi:hypothetical protein
MENASVNRTSLFDRNEQGCSFYNFGFDYGEWGNEKQGKGLSLNLAATQLEI